MLAALASHSLWAGIKWYPWAAGGESALIRNCVVPVDPFDDRVRVCLAKVRPLQQVLQPVGLSSVSQGQTIETLNTSFEPNAEAEDDRQNRNRNHARPQPDPSHGTTFS
jgi:hypothetical protein